MSENKPIEKILKEANAAAIDAITNNRELVERTVDVAAKLLRCTSRIMDALDFNKSEYNVDGELVLLDDFVEKTEDLSSVYELRCLMVLSILHEVMEEIGSSIKPSDYESVH